MMLACFSAEMLASDADPDGNHAHSSTTTFSDGVYTVTVNVDELFEMIDNGSISREGVKNLIPQEIYDALTSDGAVSDRALSLLKAYVSLATDGDTQKLFELLPLDMTLEYLTQEPDPLLWKVLSKEDLLSAMDLAKLCDELNQNGELEEIIDIQSITDIALRDGIVTEEMVTAMVNDLKENDMQGYREFVDEVAKLVLSDPEFRHICEAAIDHVLGDTTRTEKLTALVESSNAVSKLIASNSIDKEVLGTLVDDQTLQQLIEDGAVDLDGLAELTGHGAIHGLTTDQLVDFIKSEGGVSTLLDSNLLDIGKTITALGGYTVLVEEELTDVYAFIGAVGGSSALLENGIVNMHDVWDGEDSVHELAHKMPLEHIVEIFGFKRILTTIGGNALVSHSEISALIDYTTLFKTMVESGFIQHITDALRGALDQDELIKTASAYLINFSQSISINGTEIYNAFDSKIDVNRFTQILAQAMPTFDKLADNPENAFTLIVDWKLNQDNIDPETTESHYAFGIAVKLTGDTERFAALCEKLAGYISVTNQGEKTTVAINVPAKFAALYLKAVNTDLLPADLRTRLLTYLEQDLTEDNIQGIISDFTVEEIATIIEQIDFSLVPEVVDQIIDLYPTYRRALSVAKRAVNKMTYEKLLSLAQDLGIDRIENGLENNEEKIRQLREQILAALDGMADEAIEEALKEGNFGEYSELVADEIRANADLLNTLRDYLRKAVTKAFEHAPENLIGTKLCDHYKKNGQFGPIEASFSYDVAPLLEKLLGSKISEENLQLAKGFLKNTEITRDVSVQVTFDDIYEAKFINLDGDTVYVTYLPAGADLSVIYQLPALEDYDNEWTYDGETAAEVMPAKDIRLTVYDPLHVHEMEFIETVAPTCEEEGYDLYRCECHFEEHRNIVPALGHIRAERFTITATPTRHVPGKAVLGCEREGCMYTYEEWDLPELHDPEDPDSWWFYDIEEDFEGYCNEWAYIYSFLLGDDPVPYELRVSAGVQHIWGDWEITRQPSIFDGGQKKHVCETCELVEYAVVEILESGYKDLQTESGVIISGWFADGLTPVADDIEYNGSVWADADGMDDVDTIKVMDIHIANLEDRLYDSEIGLTVTIPIPEKHRNRDLVIYHKLHDGTFERFATDFDTVDEDHRLYIKDITTVLGTTPAVRFTVYSFSEFLVGMIHEHEFGDWSVENKPTLTSGGNLVRYCTDPDTQEIHEDRIDLPALSDIDYDLDRVSDPDCEHTGLDRYTYSDPNYTDANGQFFAFDVIVDALGHAWGSWSEVTPPTYSATGLLERECTREDCDGTDEYVMPKLLVSNCPPYTPRTITPANCTSKGLNEYTLEIDGQTFTYRAETPALGHTWGPWSDAEADGGKKPTNTSKGLLVRECTCENCDDDCDCTATETFVLLELIPENDSLYTCTLLDPGDCTSPPLYEYTLDKDGQTFTYEEYGLEFGHTWGPWSDAEADGGKKPTNTSKGLLVRECTLCGEDDEYVMPELLVSNCPPYTYRVIDPGDCTSPALNEYTLVKDGQTFTYEAETLEFGHTWGSWSDAEADGGKKPTKTQDGLLVRECTLCGEDDSITLPKLIPANKNFYTDYDEDPATCEDDGTETYIYITGNNQTFTYTAEIPATGHAWGHWEVTTRPSKSTAGELTRVCGNDDSHIQTHTIPVLDATDDRFDYDLEPETCEDPGTETFTYLNSDYKDANGQLFVFTVSIPAKGHDWGHWEVDTAPTKSTPGLLKRECQRDDCDEVDEHELPAFNTTDYAHTPISGATCENPGSEKYTYLNSDYKDANGQLFAFTVEIPATGHSFGLWVVTTNPTKDSEGLLTKVCANDSTHTETFPLPKLDNLLYTLTPISGATCENPGSEKYTYTKDNQTFDFTVEIPATGHAYGEWKVITNPTTAATGMLERVCANDSTHKETHTLPALNTEDYEHKIVTAPGCETKGTEKYSYTYGGKVFEFALELDAIGHKFAAWTVRVEPTMTTGGELVRICTNDPMHEQTYALPSFSEAGAYTYKVIKEPTATEPGSAVYTFTYDGQTFEFTVTLPATGVTEPDSGFPWWIIFIIVLALIIIGVAIFLIIYFKRNNDQKPPEPPIAPVAPVIEEEPEEEEPIIEEVKAPTAPATMKRSGKKTIVNLNEIDAAFSDGETVSLETLKAKGLITKSAQRYKVLANGTLTKALTVEADDLTSQAKEKILAAGGNVVTVRIQRTK